MPPAADIFVGILAIFLGCVIIAAGCLRWAWYETLPKQRWLTGAVGTTGARLVNALVGTVVIALGVWILIP